MPPPSFSSLSGLGALNVSRGTLGLVKEAAQAVHAAIAKGAPGAADTARTAVHALLADASLDAPPSDDDLLAHAEVRAQLAPNAVRTAVADKLHADMLDAFEHTTQKPETAAWMAVVGVLEMLAPLLDVGLFRRDWWGRVLLPALKCAELSDAQHKRVRTLVVYAMLAQPTAPAPEDAPTTSAAPTVAPTTPTSAAARAPPPAAPAPPSLVDTVFSLYVDLAAHQPELAPLPADEETAHAPDATPDAAPRTNATPPHAALRRELEMAIALYSAYDPSGFFAALARTLHDTPTEGPVLYLLASFLHAQSMHTYRITSTPLLDRVIDVLQHTHSTRAMSLGIKCVVMVLPHVPQYVVKGGAGGVPALFGVYARAVTWRRGTAEDAVTVCVSLLFTLLYGLFPNNLVAFLRTPAAYLDGRDAGALDANAVRTSSLALLRGHAAHPLLVEMDASTELSNTKRWAQQDASDLTASCMSLCIGAREEIGNADALLATHVPANATLLQVEHKFELYLKEQLLLHIGRLHRDRIADAAAEAEHQSLYHTLRTLRTQLQAAQTRAERQRAETQAVSQRHIQWERELNAKLNTYREERRSWATERQSLLKQLSDANTTNASQAAEITAMGTRLFELEQDLARAQPQLERIETYRANVQKLSNCMADWEEDLGKYELQSREMDKMLSWWEEMELTVANSEANANRYRSLLEQRTTENTRLTAELASLRAATARQAERLAANQTWLLEAVVAPAHDRAEPQLTRPTRAAAYNAEEVRKAHARTAKLERLTLDLRARIEELESEVRVHAQQEATSHDAETDSLLISPQTLRTPRGGQLRTSAVPPLSLDSPGDVGGQAAHAAREDEGGDT